MTSRVYHGERVSGSNLSQTQIHPLSEAGRFLSNRSQHRLGIARTLNKDKQIDISVTTKIFRTLHFIQEITLPSGVKTMSCKPENDFGYENCHYGRVREDFIGRYGCIPPYIENPGNRATVCQLQGLNSTRQKELYAFYKSKYTTYGLLSFPMFTGFFRHVQQYNKCICIFLITSKTHRLRRSLCD